MVDVFDPSSKCAFDEKSTTVTTHEIFCDAEIPRPSVGIARSRAPAASVLASARSALIATHANEQRDFRTSATRPRAATALLPRPNLRVDVLVKRASTYPLRMMPQLSSLGRHAPPAADDAGQILDSRASNDTCGDPFEFSDMLSKVWPDLFPSCKPLPVKTTLPVASVPANQNLIRLSPERPRPSLSRTTGSGALWAAKDLGSPSKSPPMGPLPPLPSPSSVQAPSLASPHRPALTGFRARENQNAPSLAATFSGTHGPSSPRLLSPVLTGRAAPDSPYQYF